MKNKKFLACLLACVCCFQSGACIPAIAEDSAQEVTEATKTLSDFQKDCNLIQKYIDGNGFYVEELKAQYKLVCDEEQNTIQLTIKNTQAEYEDRFSFQAWIYDIKRFCERKGFSEKHNITYYLESAKGEVVSEPSEEESEEYQNDIQKIQKFIEAEISDKYEDAWLARTEVLFERQPWFKKLWLMISTEENADKLKAFCEETGLSEKYHISYELWYQTDYTVIPAMRQTISQVEQFANEEKYNSGVFLMYHYDDDDLDKHIYGWTDKHHITGIYILVRDETKEDLNAVKAYCKEQGFTDEYEFAFEVHQEPATEFEADFTAGDVTLDGNVDILDVITVNKAILGKETLTAMQNKAADINRDDKVDSTDALAILKQIVGIAEA